MPIARYKIRNELSLADPELYSAADKDDPEALLEAVVMAGLAGLLRQLGDLSQFAAEIFHDLHEEVMVTAARGHGLMARVQQLEAEVPSLEKAFLSQTHHLSFFSYGGIGWHPNIQSEHNLMSRGELPRFVMDSYEECRGPPRLFLLDKFDVAGAGACLKRYTDPSFFKTESASSGVATVEVYREKKNHKFKKKGDRLKNGKTAEVAPTHTKLHQLLLEERIENACTDPGRFVKLKNRQLNGSAIEAKSGKSYMEKFLESPSLDHQVVCESSSSPNPVRLVSDDTSEAGIKILEISTVGPVKRSLGNERTYSWTNEEEAILKPSSEMHRETDGDLVRKHEQGLVGVSDEISLNYKVPEVINLGVDEQKKTENILCGYHSDDVSSEVDNYLDALATVESELEIDYEYRSKNSFLHIQKPTDSVDEEHQLQAPFLYSQSFGNSSTSDEISSFNRDINEDHVELQTRLSDSQSVTSCTSDENSLLKRDKNEEYSKLHAQFSYFQYIGKSSASDVNSSFDKDISCFSYSDSLSTVAENIPSEAMLLKSAKYSGSEIEDTSSNQLARIAETQKTDSGEFLMHDGTHEQEKEIYGTGQVSSGSYPTYSGRKLLSSDLAAASLMKLPTGAQSEETLAGPVELQLRLEDEDTKYHVESIDAIPDAISLTKNDASATVSSEKYPLNKLADGDQSVSCDAILKISNDLELASEDECSNLSKIKGLPAESPNQNSSTILVSREISKEGEHPIRSSMEVDLHSGTTLLLDGQASKAASGIEATQLNSDDLSPLVETPLLRSFIRQQCSDLIRDSPQDESGSVGAEVKCYKLQSNFEELSKMEHDDELSESACSLDGYDSLLKNSSSADNRGQDYLVTGDVVASTELQSEDQSVSVHTAENDVRSTTRPASGMISSASRNLSNLQEPAPSNSSCSDETKRESNEVELNKIAVELKAEKMENQQEPSSDSNVISSPMRRLANFKESRSNFAGPHEKPMEIIEAVPRESFTELETQRIVHQVDAACANVESSPSNKLQSEQMQTSNHLEEQRNSDAASRSVPEIHLDQSSSFETLSQSARQEVNGTKHVMNKPLPLLPDHFSTVSKINFEEMPPMPPLPPMQWRTGKVQPASFASHREVIKASHASFRPIQPIKSKEQIQYSLPTSERDALQFQSPVLPVMAVEGDKLQKTSGLLVGGHPVAISLQLPIMLNEANGQYNYLLLERSQTPSPFLTLPVPVVSTSKPAQGYIVASEGEMVQNSNSSPPMPPVEHAISAHDPISPQEQSQPPSQLMTEPSLEVEALQQSANNQDGKERESSMSPPSRENAQPNHSLLPSDSEMTSPLDTSALASDSEREKLNGKPKNKLQQSANNQEGEQRDPSISPMSPPRRENARPNHNLLPSDSEMASPLDTSAQALDFEREKLNGKSKNKLPHPQSPLIDAVAALDKSKLRKVAERVRPPIAPKVQERDSFLEQIRTKSFNLKPAVPTRHRYRYQGPKTNLKVAAILEKANAIRQVLAGSDDDDDVDSWSDS